MIELMNNCTHFSEHATYLATDEFGGRKIIKASTSKSGIANLYNEIQGLNWYQRRRYPAAVEPICRITQEKCRYLQIQITYIDGYALDYRSGLERNVDAVRSIVRHYCDIWPRASDLVPLHGDFSLGNMIMNFDGVHVIDWEHYTADAVPWGFDALELLFETLYFGMRSRFEPTVRGISRAKLTGREIQIIREQINVMNECRSLCVDMMRNPLRFLKEYAVRNHHLWGKQFMKFPILGFTSEQIAMIDAMIRAGAA